MMDSTINDIFRMFRHGNGEWQHFIKSIKINNIHGWHGQEIHFDFPVVAIVGENGIGKSTFLKAAVCAYRNKGKKDFYPSKMFMRTQWDEQALDGATIEYRIRQGNNECSLKWKKTKDWGYTPKKDKPERDVYFLGVARTLPLDATAGYAKIAMNSNTETGNNTTLSEEAIKNLRHVLGVEYSNARFTGTDIDSSKEVGLLTREFGEISQFHQGAGEDAMLDTFKVLEEIPKYSLLVIDEVENSLHPRAQRRFIQYLLKIAKSKKLQIILSTHSPFVLEELPEVARIMLVGSAGTKDIIYGVSSSYALSSIDDNQHPEFTVYLEDRESEEMFWEILKTDREKFPVFAKKIRTITAGSYTVVKEINNYCKRGILNGAGVGVVDGDKREECAECLSLVGDLAPEKQVYSDFKQINWNNLDNRFGLGAGTLFGYLDEVILLPNHHLWNEKLGDKIHKSQEVVWNILVDEWCKQCLSEEMACSFIEMLEQKMEERHN